MKRILMKWLDKIPFTLLLMITLTLGMAPFMPEPHLVEKLKMLFAGQLRDVKDMFDLVMHGAAPALLILKMVRTLSSKSE